ncbi:MAG TPA: HNH endonuclease domain-containing protein [Chthoniobacterales bacterium]
MKSYPLQTPSATPNCRDLHLAFDVGHSSIGWAVLQVPANDVPNLLGCGAVIFQADDCLASQRRAFRRQRRHIRSTRLRIARMKALLAHLRVFTAEGMDGVQSSSPWFLAARVLAGGDPLTWPELWDVLRWYAHNRGYDGNRRWNASEAEAEQADTEKVENAHALCQKYGTTSMAATLCAALEIDPLGKKSASMIRFKGLDAAFPREQVEREVIQILQAHFDRLPAVNEALIKSLIEDWRAIPCPHLRLPDRYKGGLLFGQLVPRFENRIIAQCPVTYEREYQRLLAETGDEQKAKRGAAKAAKVPSRDSVEFYRYRWAMQLANVQIATGEGRKTRPLTVEERRTVDAAMREHGSLTVKQFKEAVRQLTGGLPDNLGTMLSHPEAQKALLLDPALKQTGTGALAIIWPHLDETTRKHTLTKLRRFKRLSVREIVGDHFPALAALENHVIAANTKKDKKSAPISLDELLAEYRQLSPQGLRAPYHREVMIEACRDVFEKGIHPKEEGGCLYRDERIRAAQLQRAIDEQTNNHLVRHRLLILERLHRDMLKEYAGEDPKRVAKLTIEVNRELREMSGKTAKEVAMEEGQRLANFKNVTKKLEAAFAGKNIVITAGLIRKARIAEDLGWKCPYTGKEYDAFDLLTRKVDKDHIIPRSLRPSDSLDSLVITFSEVNRMKGQRTALQFIEDEQGKVVEGAPQLSLKTAANFWKEVESLETFKGHEDDQRRKKNRKRLLQLREYVEKEFTPGDLTQTSQLVRLGAQTLQRSYLDLDRLPVMTSLPGAVTGGVRKSWRLLGCLTEANPGVTEETTKTEVRHITHLHHALDASVLAFASHFLPRNGNLWELLVKRRLTEAEQAQLLQLSSQFQRGSDGRVSLSDLPVPLKKQLRERLAERRVVQHIPADPSGLVCDETVYRVFDPADPHPSARQLAQWFRKQNAAIPAKDSDSVLITNRKRRSAAGPESGRLLHETRTWRWTYQLIEKSKLLGLEPRDPATAKLQPLKAVKILSGNFGLALDPEPEVLRAHKIWPKLRELKAKNGGKWPRILRNGMLIEAPRGKFQGVWKVASAKANLKLDLISADRVKMESSGAGIKGNVLLKSLIKDGLIIVKTSLVGYGNAQRD